MKSPLTTLCYIEKDDKYLMLHRVSKKNDVNKDKWIGIGGHFEEGESPEECLLREAREETGLILTSWKFRGIVTFVAEDWPPEYMCLFTADGFVQDEKADYYCNEGTLEWVPKSEVTNLNLWEGDKIFLKLLAEDAPFFSMKLMYKGDILSYASLNGKELELLDICDENGNPTGRVTERSVAHSTGVPHRTAHVWVVRKREDGGYDVLLQKRSLTKDSFPGYMDTSAAGHVAAGCECLESARRELYEELGIDAAPEELAYVGYFNDGELQAEFDGKLFRNHEIGFVHVYQKEINTEHLKLQKEEVDSVHWMDYNECLTLVSQGAEQFCMRRSGLELVGKYLRILPE